MMHFFSLKILIFIAIDPSNFKDYWCNLRRFNSKIFNFKQFRTFQFQALSILNFRMCNILDKINFEIKIEQIECQQDL